MRNGTKIKHILKENLIDVGMENGIFKLSVIHKEVGSIKSYEGKTWSSVINQAHKGIQPDNQQITIE